MNETKQDKKMPSYWKDTRTINNFKGENKT